MKETIDLLRAYNKRHRTPFGQIHIFDDYTGRVCSESDPSEIIVHFDSIEDLHKQLKR